MSGFNICGFFRLIRKPSSKLEYNYKQYFKSKGTIPSSEVKDRQLKKNGSLALEEVYISMFRSSRAITFRLDGRTQ